MCGLSWLTHSLAVSLSFRHSLYSANCTPSLLYVCGLTVVVVVNLFCCDSVISNRFKFAFCQDLIASLFFWGLCVEKWFNIGWICLWGLLGCASGLFGSGRDFSILFGFGFAVLVSLVSW